MIYFIYSYILSITKIFVSEYKAPLNFLSAFLCILCIYKNLQIYFYLNLIYPFKGPDRSPTLVIP